MLTASNIQRSGKGWLKTYAKLGIIAKGTVYVLIGVLALLAALGEGGQTSGKVGVFNWLQNQPLGTVLLILMGIGLIGYAAWRFIRGIIDPDDRGEDVKGIGMRASFILSGLLYGFFGGYAVYLATTNSSGSGDTRQDLISWLLGLPAGQWIVGLVALIILVKAFYQFYKGLTDKYKDNISTYNLDSRERETFEKIAKAGLIARGVIFSIIGYFLVRAALNANPSQAKGTGGAFDFITQNTFGMVLLGIVACGLVCYGIFMFFKAKYGQVDGAF